MSRVQIDLPAFVQRDVAAMAQRDGVSPEQLMVIAIAEKMAALRMAEQIIGPEARRLRRRFRELLAKAPDVPPMPGDEIPPDLAAKLKRLRSHRASPK
jgi:hypothetical protein